MGWRSDMPIMKPVGPKTEPWMTLALIEITWDL